MRKQTKFRKIYKSFLFHSIVKVDSREQLLLLLHTLHLNNNNKQLTLPKKKVKINKYKTITFILCARVCDECFVLSVLWREMNRDRRQLADLASVQVQRESFIFIYHIFFKYFYVFYLHTNVYPFYTIIIGIG